MKSTGHCLITSSTPFHSVILKTRGRLSTDFFYFLRKTLCAYQNSKLHSTALVGAEHYPPPCFRTLAHLISKRRVSTQKCLLPKQLSIRLAICCGCPSPRVAGHGCFGVRLTLDLKFLAEAMCVIGANTNAPVSVKYRILDDHDSYNELFERSASAPMDFQRVNISCWKMCSWEM